MGLIEELQEVIDDMEIHISGAHYGDRELESIDKAWVDGVRFALDKIKKHYVKVIDQSDDIK